VLYDVGLVRIGSFGTQLRHESRNPLAFIHQGLNLPTAQIMGKPTRTSFSEERDCPPRAVKLSSWLCRHRK
jgi:hypothetical protein